MPEPCRPTMSDDGRRAVEAERAVAGAEDGGQLLVDDLDDHLAGVDVLDDVRADGALLDARHEVLDDLVVDVRLEEREAHLAHGDVDVCLGDAAVAGQAGEGVAEAVGEGVEHGGQSSGARARARARRLLHGEERRDEGVGVEVAQVVDLLADAHEEDRHAQSARSMAKAMPPLAVESSLVSAMAVSPDDSWKALAWSRPFWPVVASSTKSTSGCGLRQALGDGAADLGQLVHQVATWCAAGRRCRR